jgi:hypothetical protein
VRRVTVLAFFVMGLAGVGGGGWLVYSELARPATHAEVTAAGQAEIASRWERLAAGQIFPAIIHYAAPSGLVTTAYRVGIAPRSSCHAATVPRSSTSSRPAMLTPNPWPRRWRMP